MSPITFTFTPAYQDYVTTTRAYLLRQPAMWGGALLAGLAVVLCIYVFGAGGSAGILLIGLVPPILIALYLIVTPILVASRAQKSPDLVAALSCEATLAGIHVQGQNVNTLLDWRLFSNAIETKRYFVLVFRDSRKMFQMVPKRAFVDDADAKRFGEMARQKSKNSN